MLCGKQERGEPPVRMPDQMHTSEVEFIDQHRQVVRVHLRGIDFCWPGYVPIREIVATTVGDDAIMRCQ